MKDDPSTGSGGTAIVSVALREAAGHLAATSGTPRLDAELLMAHALGTSREEMLLHRLAEPAPVGFPALLARRVAHEPIAYITGTRAFWTIELGVRPGVLIPRPDSETLIEAAVAHFAGTAGPRTVLDLGTGSGALLLAALAEWPLARGVGIDRSPVAIAVARANAARLGMGERAEIRAGGWEGTGAAFDLVLCNPPYVGTGDALPRDVREHEPAEALFAGADGLDDYRALAPLLGRQIARAGIACIELGAGQAAAVRATVEAEGLRTETRNDIAGIPRCLIVSGSAGAG